MQLSNQEINSSFEMSFHVDMKNETMYYKFELNITQYKHNIMCLFLFFAQVTDSLVQELQQKAEETELLHRELQMLETERVRLSLVEEKLMDLLQLLQQLRDLVSLRANTKIQL